MKLARDIFIAKISGRLEGLFATFNRSYQLPKNNSRARTNSLACREPQVSLLPKPGVQEGVRNLAVIKYSPLKSSLQYVNYTLQQPARPQGVFTIVALNLTHASHQPGACHQVPSPPTVRTGGPTESTMKALKLQCNGTPREAGSPCFCFIFASCVNLSHSGQCPIIFFSRTEECICLQAAV